MNYKRLLLISCLIAPSDCISGPKKSTFLTYEEIQDELDTLIFILSFNQEKPTAQIKPALAETNQKKAKSLSLQEIINELSLIESLLKFETETIPATIQDKATDKDQQ